MDCGSVHTVMLVITDIVITHSGGSGWGGLGRGGTGGVTGGVTGGGGSHVHTGLWYGGTLGIDHMLRLLSDRAGRSWARSRSCLVTSYSSSDSKSSSSS